MSPPVIRPPRMTELDALSALKIRSKAYWGYHAAFMQACKEELTLTPEHLAGTAAAVAVLDETLAGVAQVGPRGRDADLLGLFVDPPFIGTGLGKILFDWCLTAARGMSQTRLLIEADPGAAAFYEHMGAQRIGASPSGSIPGRMLPLYEVPLR